MENVDEILNHKYNKVSLVDKFVIVYVYRKIKISTFRIINLSLTITQCYYLQIAWNKYKTEVAFIPELIFIAIRDKHAN